MKQLYAGIAFVMFAVVAGSYVASTKSGTTSMAAAADRSDKISSVASLVVGLEERLEQQPDDGKGWLLLAKSYRHLGRLDDAREAYRKADALGNGDATVATQLFGLTAAGQ